MKPESFIDAYLSAYITRRRVIIAVSAVEWAVVFSMSWLFAWCLLDHWLVLGNPIRCVAFIVGGLTVLAIVVPPLSFVFRRYDPLAVATEIEKLQPVFDQRLITIASTQTDTPLLAHLRNEVVTIAKDRGAVSLVSLRPMLTLALTITVLLLAFAAIAHLAPLNFPYLLNRFYSPLSAN